MLLLPFRTSHSAFRNCAIFLLVTGHLSLVTSAFAADPPITEAELVRRTQELYDSIVSGNQAPWKNRSSNLAST